METLNNLPNIFEQHNIPSENEAILKIRELVGLVSKEVTLTPEQHSYQAEVQLQIKEIKAYLRHIHKG